MKNENSGNQKYFREADDFCGHRGLQAGSDEQTFSMSIPVKLRTYYDKIVTPASEMSGLRAGPRVQQLSGNAVKHMVDAYNKMNKFLTRFLEHVSLSINNSSM